MTNTLTLYINKWSLAEPELLTKTLTSDLYLVRRNEEKAVLKILSKTGAEDERAAAGLLEWYDGKGAVNLLASDDGAMLLEYAGGGDLTELVAEGKDEAATKIIADVLNDLHLSERGEPPQGLTPLRVRFRSLLDKPVIDPLLALGAQIAEKLLSEDRPAHALHGDIHHENIRRSARGWLAIDPKGLVGERIYDAANTLCNPISMPDHVQNPQRLKQQAEILAAKMGVPEDRLLSYAFAHACLSACWSMEDGQNLGHTLAMANIIRDFVPI